MTHNEQVNIIRAHAVLDHALDLAIDLLKDPEIPPHRQEATLKFIQGAKERATILFEQRSLSEKETDELVRHTYGDPFFPPPF